MMNRELLVKMSLLASKERGVTLEVIRYLRLIYIRRAFVEAGYSSIWDYCVQALKYSDGAAKRRIDAMHALGEHPELEGQIADGSLSLSTVSQVQSYIRKNRLAGESRLDLFKQMAGKSKREVEEVLEPERKVTLTISKELFEKMRALQSLLAHQVRSPEELLEKLVSLGEKHLDPAREPRGRLRDGMTSPAKLNETKPSDDTRGGDVLVAAARTRYIPASIRREVWQRSKKRCTYIDPATGKSCDSRHALQIDHIEPYARGGSNNPSNLRLLCRQHNLHRAVDLAENSSARPPVMS